MSTRLIQIAPIQVTITEVPAPAAQGSLRWHVGPVIQKQGVSAMPNEYTLTREQGMRFFIEPLTPGGAVAPIDGAAQWTVEGIPCTVQPIDNQSIWLISPATGVGDTVLTVKADADMGAGVVTLMDTSLIHVTDPMASNLGMGADAPVLKTDIPPA